jgi:hypothetical protein
LVRHVGVAAAPGRENRGGGGGCGRSTFLAFCRMNTSCDRSAELARGLAIARPPVTVQVESAVRPHGRGHSLWHVFWLCQGRAPVRPQSLGVGRESIRRSTSPRRRGVRMLFRSSAYKDPAKGRTGKFSGHGGCRLPLEPPTSCTLSFGWRHAAASLAEFVSVAEHSIHSRLNGFSAGP